MWQLLKSVHYQSYSDKLHDEFQLISHFAMKGRNLYCYDLESKTPSRQRCLRLDRKRSYLYRDLACFILVVILYTGVFSVPAFAQGNTVKVAVAANLLLPMQEVKKLYEEKYSGELMLIPGSSGKLTAQIINGAPYDIFLSADMKYPEQIYNEGHAVRKPEVLLRGRLVFWSKAQPEEPLEAWLLQADIQSLAIAQPELAPYGQSAKDWLSEKRIYDIIQPKIIFGESIGQVNQYIRSGAVEAAFTAISAMQAEEMKGRGHWLPLTVYSGDPSRLDHGLVLLENAVAPETAINQFIEFIKSPIAAQVFQGFGYEVIE